MGLSVQEKKQKTDFQDGDNGGHPGFHIGTIFAIFYVQVTLMLPTKFQVNSPFGSTEDLGFPIGRIFFIYKST